MKTINDILKCNLISSNTIDKDSLVIDAFTLMESENLDYVIVMEDGVCIGIMSEIDYLHKIILTRKDPKKIKVKEIMSSSICAVDINEPIHRCLELMDTFKIRHLLVFVDFMYKGVVTLHDLMQASLKGNLDDLMEQENSKYISSSNNSTNSFIKWNLYN